MPSTQKLLLVGTAGAVLFIGLSLFVMSALNKGTQQTKDGSSKTDFPTPTLFVINPSDIPDDIPAPPIVYVTQVEERARISNPGVFLANKMPYETAFFSVTRQLTEANGGTYVFTVKSKTDADIARQAFLEWLGEQGLTQTQINSLTVVYE